MCQNKFSLCFGSLFFAKAIASLDLHSCNTTNQDCSLLWSCPGDHTRQNKEGVVPASMPLVQGRGRRTHWLFFRSLEIYCYKNSNNNTTYSKNHSWDAQFSITFHELQMSFHVTNLYRHRFWQLHNIPYISFSIFAIIKLWYLWQHGENLVIFWCLCP